MKLLRWVIALISGIFSSLILMAMLATGVVQQGGDLGTDLVLSKFFVVTGGFLFLGESSTRLEYFVGASVYYFLLFTLLGFAIGLIIENIIKVTRD